MIDEELVEKVYAEKLPFYPALEGITESQAEVFVQFAKVWGPIMETDPRFGIPIENFLSKIRASLPKPCCFGTDDCSTNLLRACKVARLCGEAI